MRAVDLWWMWYLPWFRILPLISPFTSVGWLSLRMHMHCIPGSLFSPPHIIRWEPGYEARPSHSYIFCSKPRVHNKIKYAMPHTGQETVTIESQFGHSFTLRCGLLIRFIAVVTYSWHVLLASIIVQGRDEEREPGTDWSHMRVIFPWICLSLINNKQEAKERTRILRVYWKIQNWRCEA